MSRYIQNLILLLFLGIACKSMAVSEQFSVEDYLLEAKECFSFQSSKPIDAMELTGNLQKNLSQADVDAYVSY